MMHGQRGQLLDYSPTVTAKRSLSVYGRVTRGASRVRFNVNQEEGGASRGGLVTREAPTYLSGRDHHDRKRTIIPLQDGGEGSISRYISERSSNDVYRQPG